MKATLVYIAHYPPGSAGSQVEVEKVEEVEEVEARVCTVIIPTQGF